MSANTETKTRAQYLQMLGIVQYLPRELEGSQDANASERLGHDEHEGEVLAAVKQVSSQSAEITDKLRHNQPEVAVEEKVTQEKSAPIAVELSLALWQPADDVLICCAVDDDLPNQQQLSLLANIVKSMGQTISTLPQFELINWPPHRNMQGGEPEAREYLSTLIKARVESRSTKTLLLMGQSAGEWLLSPEQIASVEQGLVSVTENLTALLVPSLQDMMADQVFKRVAWEVISSYLAAQSKPQSL